MPMIYKRFTEKTAEEWRQIYKVSWIESPRLQSNPIFFFFLFPLYFLSCSLLN